jgi:hypothetical protein
MTSRMTTTLVRAGVGALTVALAFSPIMIGGAAQAKAKHHKATSSLPQYRAQSAPNTFYPLGASKRVKDRKTWNRRRHLGTDISTPCGSTARAAHPGTALVATNPAWGGKVVVRVVSNHNGLVTSYGFLWRSAVQQGQIVQSGQALGTVGGQPKTGRCALYFSVWGGGHFYNPTPWLNAFVGKPAPVRYLFGNTGFTIASFNMLGASHTPSGRYAAYTSRTPRALALLKARGVDVAGLQEFEQRQADLMLRDTTFKSFFGAFKGGKPDSRNAIIWRDSTMQFVSGETLPIKYFNGSIIQIPVVLLRQRSTGRTAYFMNTHNPASNVFGYGNQAPYRNYDLGVEKAKIVQLRATGRPVFFTGDFNDRAAAFCPMTANKLTISANSIPSLTCAFPKQSSIDWIFAAGQARFSTFTYDRYSKDAKISDHPMILARAHLQN